MTGHGNMEAPLTLNREENVCFLLFRFNMTKQHRPEMVVVESELWFR
jgi:hypothetical protein